MLDASSSTADIEKERRPCPGPLNSATHVQFPTFSLTVDDDDEDKEEEMKFEHSIDHGVIECLLRLLLQSSSSESESCFTHASRMLLQHVKSSPMTMPQIIASHVSIPLEDLFPIMALFASLFLRSWLGCHLASAEFQWPDALWGH